MNHWGWDYMGNGMDRGLGGFALALFRAFVIVAIVVLVKWLIGGFGVADKAGEKPALDILKAKYAGGEIECDEFEQKKHDIG